MIMFLTVCDNNKCTHPNTIKYTTSKSSNVTGVNSQETAPFRERSGVDNFLLQKS